jgi:hypothetical protein
MYLMSFDPAVKQSWSSVADCVGTPDTDESVSGSSVCDDTSEYTYCSSNTDGWTYYDGWFDTHAL